MNTSENAAAQAKPGLSVWIVTLLAIAMFVNYVDRGSLSVVAPVLKDTLHVSSADMGLLLSSFFWSYTLAQPFAGSLVQRFDVRLVLAVGLGAWAAATMMCGLAGSFVALLALRLVMGLGESIIYPANAKILAERSSEAIRGRCNGLISMAMCAGPAGGTLAGGLILAHFGWRATFLALGGASLLWLIPWLSTRLAPAPTATDEAQAKGPGYWELLRTRALWGASVGQFCYSFQFYLLLTWLPFFLVKAEHVSLTAMAGISASVYAVQALAALFSGWASDALVRAGGSATLVRKGFVMSGLALGGATFVLVGTGPHTLMIPSLLACGFFTGFANPMCFSIGQSLAGPSAGGRWMGIQNMVGNFAGISAPMVTGMILQTTGAFTGAFFLAALLAVLGLVCWGLVLGRVEPVKWREDHGQPGAVAPASAV
jgi:MFS family permease